MIGAILAERYEIRALLGEGAMASVYDAFDIKEERPVAIKVPHGHVLASEELRARFEREGRAAISMDHPGVVRAFELGRAADGAPYLVFERALGEPLHHALQAPIAWSRAVLLGEQIALAAIALHEQGIVHRDLKPENILLARGENDEELIKVLDFGIAKLSGPTGATEEGMTRLGYVYGTPEYMAPEQALGQEVDEKADVYSVGVILFELASGRRPYEGKANQLLGQQLTKPIPSLRRLVGPEVPEGFETLIGSMLAVTSAARPTMSEVRGALRRLRDTDGIEPEPRPPLGAAERALGSEGRRSIRLGHVVLVGALSAGLGAASALSLRSDPPAEFVRGQQPSPKSAEATPAPPRTGEQILRELNSPSLDDLIVLSREHSSEPLIQLELARAYLEAKEYASAVESATVALGLDPSLNRNPVLSAILQKLAQMQTSSDGAFRLLRGPMGQEGADILYELSMNSTVRPLIRAHATSALDSAEVRENLSLPLALARDLGAAHSCKDLRPLIERAAIVGDDRALPRLESLNSNLDCKKRGAPCYPCLREESDLRQAILAIQSRSRDHQGTPEEL